MVESENVGRVQINDDTVQIILHRDADLEGVGRVLYPHGRNADARQRPAPTLDTVYTAVRIDDPSLVERLSDSGVDFFRQQSPAKSPLLGFISSWIVPVMLMYLLFRFLSRKIKAGGGMGGMMNAGKSKAKEYSLEKSTGVKYTDVAGQDEAKESLAELCDFLHKYHEIGAPAYRTTSLARGGRSSSSLRTA